MQEKKTLTDKAEDTTRRLTRANKLTVALADEQVRWTLSVENLDKQLNDLVGNMYNTSVRTFFNAVIHILSCTLYSFLSAGCIAYFGAFTSTYRKEIVQQWIKMCQEQEIPVSDSFNLVDTLADQVQVRDWSMQSLPSDMLSIENGLLVTRGRRWPLMIDPQGQANRWIRKMEGSNLRVVKMNDPKFLRSLENAVRIGQPVLLEDVGETLDPALEPLLLKQLVRQGGRLLLKLGDTFVDYDKNFRLYITSKLTNPHYLPEVCIKVTIINFTVTNVGLEGQLLSDVVKLERPELEEQRDSLIVSLSKDKKLLKDIEEKILKMLYNSQGNILDDEELINTLNQSKVTSSAIHERVKLAEETEQQINNAREKYRPVALRGSVLFFVLANLAEIDPMYQFSLRYFKNLFGTTIQQTEKQPDLMSHISQLCANITSTVFNNISRALFEQHKMVFSFMICADILRESGSIPAGEWNIFLRGPAGSGAAITSAPTKPRVDGLSDQAWKNMHELTCAIETLKPIADRLQSNPQEWTRYMTAESPFLQPVPAELLVEAGVSDFQKLLLVKALREEKLVSSILHYIRKSLGEEYISMPTFELGKVFADTNSATPLIFILSPGSDPVASVLKFAKESGYADRLHIISLGQGQGPIAQELVKRSVITGDWVFLQNCHLAASWMPKLENIIKELAAAAEGDTSGELGKVRSEFRLILSSMPSRVFPVSVLQDGVKVTNEPPKGLRANLARVFADVSREMYENDPPMGMVFRKLLFGVAFFNAMIHERKRFGPLGWNINYDWSNSDVEVAMVTLRNLLTEYASASVPWDALNYMTGEIIFGGRVTDDWDRRCLRSILGRFYSEPILDDRYKFSPSGVYHAPNTDQLARVRSYVDGLPLTEEPEIFGMHENANISYQLQESRRMVRTVLDVQPRLMASSGGAGKSSEDIVSAKAAAILESWPVALEFDSSGASADPVAQEMFRTDDGGRMLNSLSTVVIQEAARFNKLLLVVRRSLESVINAVKGLVVMSADLELVFKSLLNNEVPLLWANAAYPSLKPLASWVKDLHERVDFIRTWLERGQPQTFWLSGFFFPQGKASVQFLLFSLC